MFIAAALAHNETGRPISTRISFAPWALNNWLSCKPRSLIFRVTVGHCDLKDNLDNILKIMMNLGAYVQFDTIGKNDYYPDEKRVAMLHALHDRGLLNRVMLSMDITRRSHLKANGGYGYDYLLTTFIPQLRSDTNQQYGCNISENTCQFFQ